jgi:predicted transglutaminase-like cysteine proteinase
MATGDKMAAPAGFVDYCSRTATCVAAASGQATDKVELDAAKRQLITSVNRGVNSAIVPDSDRDVYARDEFWADPLLEKHRGFARGDCEDFALAKRDRLLAAGWPPEAMFLAVAYHPRLGLHAVLVVRTTDGDLVLDSRSPYADLWSDTVYVWVARQVNATSSDWVRPYPDVVPPQITAQIDPDKATAATSPD